MELSHLRPLYDAYGDYVSVYLDVDRAHEDAPHAIELRWRSARERLAAESADPATLDAVQEIVTDPANAAPGIAVFARHGAARLSRKLPDAPRREIAEPVSERADAAIARAIVCTDAVLWFLPADVPSPRDGIGATLRYPAA